MGLVDLNVQQLVFCVFGRIPRRSYDSGRVTSVCGLDRLGGEVITLDPVLYVRSHRFYMIGVFWA